MGVRVALLTCIWTTIAWWPATADDDAVDGGFEIQRARQELFQRAVDRASPWVVQVETIGGAQSRHWADGLFEQDDGTPPQDSLFRDTLGSDFLVADGPTTGVVYESDGWILTSSFNFVREPSHITVRLADGRHFVAELVGRDKVRKLAMLKIDATDLQTPEWVPTCEIRVGQSAIALGRGFGGEYPSVTAGVVSAVNRMLGNGIQTDAKLSPANYGGPLIDLEGRILGICVPMAQRQGELAGVELYDAGVGFAVPEHRVQEIGRALRQGQSFYRGWLGIQIDPRYRGALKIHRVADPSPVWGLGIRSGDLIIQANGHDTRNIGHLRKAIYMMPAGEPVQIVVRRDGLDYGYEVVLARSTELGPLAEEVPPIDPDRPFRIPGDDSRPWRAP